MYTNEQLNDPNLFSGPEYDADRKASYDRAYKFYKAMQSIQNKPKIVRRKSK